jgi:hypothetical protein
MEGGREREGGEGRRGEREGGREGGRGRERESTFHSVFLMNQSMLTTLVSLFGVFSLQQSRSIILNPTWWPSSESLRQ